MKINLDYMWTDPRLRWSLDPPPAAPTWMWPKYTLVDHKQVSLHKPQNSLMQFTFVRFAVKSYKFVIVTSEIRSKI